MLSWNTLNSSGLFTSSCFSVLRITRLKIIDTRISNSTRESLKMSDEEDTLQKTRHAFEDLCRALNMDEESSNSAWRTYENISKNYTLEVNTRIFRPIARKLPIYFYLCSLSRTHVNLHASLVMLWVWRMCIYNTFELVNLKSAHMYLTWVQNAREGASDVMCVCNVISGVIWMNTFDWFQKGTMVLL